MATWKCKHCGRTSIGDSSPGFDTDCVEHEVWRPGANHPFYSSLHEWVNKTEENEKARREEAARIEAKNREVARKREEERVYAEWLATDEGKRWQESERIAKESERKAKELEEKKEKKWVFFAHLFFIFRYSGLFALIGLFLGMFFNRPGLFAAVGAGIGLFIWLIQWNHMKHM